MRSALRGGDPLDFVNAFFRSPLEAPRFPRDYWEKRVCAVAEMLPEIGKEMIEERMPAEDTPVSVLHKNKPM